MIGQPAFFQVKVVVISEAGAPIHEVIRDAMILALTEARIVEFEFNETKIVIDPGKLIDIEYGKWLNERSMNAGTERT